MVDRMLVPLDGTAVAEAAMPYAALIPSRLVYLLMVEPMSTTGRAGGRETTLAAEHYLERHAEGLRRLGREVEIIVLTGDPATRILETAADADLIVMATHGRGAVGRVWRGGVADAVARRASPPTLVVRAPDQSVATPVVSRLVVPLDGSALSEAAIPVAAELARQIGVGLHLVRVAEPPVIWESVAGGSLPGGTYEGTFAGELERAGTYLTGQERHITGGDLAVSSESRYGSPADEILLGLVPGDMVVMSTHGRGGLRRWVLGSVTERLVREAPVPVMIVRQHGT